VIILGDCLPAMREMKDNAFDLAIVDPPYGIGFDGDSTLGNNSSAKWTRPIKNSPYALKNWDSYRPDIPYFNELRRVSRAQIICGGNYFTDMLPPSGGWIVWEKGTAKGMSLSDAELLWTNAVNNVKVCSFLWSGFRKCEQTERFHPTQKPVRLYQWLLLNYAKPGDKILDTHSGSGSLAIACDIMGYELTAYEIDVDYFNASVERLKKHQSQGVLGL
jgi:site-specific DNA-methyltransferase (adenine-specific)